MIRPTLALLTLAASILLPEGARAQDAFGSAVALTGPDEVVALKPGAARGPSQGEVFRWSGEGWVRTQRLGMLPGGMPGETLTPWITAGAGSVLLGAGDPDGALAGHLYHREGERWEAVVRVPLDPTRPSPAGLPDSGLDMTTLMALMSPPPRRAALSRDGTRLAVAGGALGDERIRVLRGESSAWEIEAELTVPDDVDASGLGAALAMHGDLVLAGAPGMTGGGGALLWQREASGEWRLVARLTSEITTREDRGRLGSAVALLDGEAIVGDPGRNEVRRYRPDSSGTWSLAGVLTPESPAAESADGDRARSLGFGSALDASPTHLVIGAPGGATGGAVFVFGRDTEEGWSYEGRLAPEEVDPGDGLGSAVSLDRSRIVAGAPGALGGQGRVAVFEVSDLAADPEWLEGATTLEAVAGEDPILCAEGSAQGFECDAVDLVSFLPLSGMGAAPGERVSDIWGWTDPETRREYVLAGRTAGMAVVDVTNPGTPIFVGLMPGNPSGARDIKVYRDHAFLTGDGAGDHGLLVLDLNRVRGVSPQEMPVTFDPDARYDEVASAHNLVIDTESGFAYTVGTNTGGQSCGGGLHMIDIRDPLSPAFAGCFTDSEGLIWSGRTHDAQCTVYRGPDETYRGRQICFAANETAMRIVDVTDKANPVSLGSMVHPGTAYVHQGWLTEDHRYLYVNDELDEIVGTSDRTRTLIWDVTELDDPILAGEYLGPDQSTDHNLYIRGNRAYLANYQAGMRVLDISDPESPVEVGWFDTTPYGANAPGFGGGAWTAWPFFESGLVVVSSMNEGLFVLRPRPIIP